MAFTDLTKDELQKAAKFYKVDVDLNATKANIANALLDAGHTPEDWAEDSEAHDEGLADEKEERGGVIETSDLNEDEEEEEEEDKPEPKKAERESEEKMVLVRFVGNNASYSTGKWTFSRNRPFALMTRDQYDALNHQKFRLASKAEAEEFYAQ